MFRFLAASTLLLSACHPAGSNSPTQGNTVEADNATKLVPTWTYSTSTDKMRGENAFFAEIYSLNAPELDFPYKGGSPIQLRLKKFSSYKTIYEGGAELSLSNGQFDCTGFGNNSCFISAKFDNGKIIDVMANEYDCGSIKCLGIEFKKYIEDGWKGHGIVETIMKSKTVTLEVPLYKYGPYQYEFNLDGLKWSARVDAQ